jgi:hypothetical protein
MSQQYLGIYQELTAEQSSRKQSAPLGVVGACS